LYQLLPPENDTATMLSSPYTLRSVDNNMVRKNFLYRMLFMVLLCICIAFFLYLQCMHAVVMVCICQAWIKNYTFLF